MAAETFDFNTDYPNNDDENPPQNPPAFPAALYKSCKLMTQRVRHNDQAIYFHKNCVLVKTNNTCSSLMDVEATNNANNNDDDDDDDDDESSCGSISTNDSMEDVDDTNMQEEPDEAAVTHSQPVVEERGYLIDRPIRNAIFGAVYLGYVLTRNDSNEIWRLTDNKVAIKIMDLAGIRQSRGKAENPERECEAMQYLFQRYRQLIGSDCPYHIMNQTNTIMQVDALYDETHFYNITPYVDGGELDLLRGALHQASCRNIIKKILNAMNWLQKAGTCHRDVSPENLLITQQEQIYLIDMGMCIKVPYLDGRRALINPQGPCGKIKWISPEILRNELPFDGFAVDLWAAGVLLLTMLAGEHPWKEGPIDTDDSFRLLSGGNLVQILTAWQVVHSDSAKDLLQRMLFSSAQDRLCLSQILSHPWMRE